MSRPSNSINSLKALSRKIKKEKFPSLPDYALSVYSYKDTTANGLTRCVIDWINFHGFQAERISVTGRIIDNRQVVQDCMGFQKVIGSTRRIFSSGTRGSADISAVINGRAVKIEIKMRDKQSEAQRAYQESIEKAGGVYIIVHSLDEFMDWWNTFCPTHDDIPF